MNLRSAPLPLFGALLCVFLASSGFSVTAQQTAPKGTAAHADTALKTLPPDSVVRETGAKAVSLITKRCAGCHNAKNPKGGLNLEPGTLVAAVRDVPSRRIGTLKLVDTRAPEKSYFLMKIRGDKGIQGARMPINAAPFTAAETRTIETWIQLMSRPPAGPKPAPAAGDSARKG